MTRQILNIIFACLIASTFYHDYVVASRLKKKILLKGLVGAGLLVKYLKPKKGILPFPIPLPLPLPIEWEQPPIIVHSKHHHVPIPQPVPMPVHTPVHVPSRTPSCDLNPGSTFELKGELVSSPKHSSAKLYLHPCTKNILHLTNHIVMDPNSGRLAARQDLVKGNGVRRLSRESYIHQNHHHNVQHRPMTSS